VVGDVGEVDSLVIFAVGADALVIESTNLVKKLIGPAIHSKTARRSAEQAAKAECVPIT
jgi:ribonuclease BN (tRNA processing enzyme)